MQKLVSHALKVYLKCVFLREHKKGRDVGFAPVYFNSTTKTVINSDKYLLQKYVQKLLYKIENWINEGFGWVIESTDAEYMNISIYRPL